MKTTVEALKALYVSLGGSADDVENIVLIPDMVEAIAKMQEYANVTVLPAIRSKTYWGTAVTAMQDTDIAIQGKTISGSIKYVNSGTLVNDWGVHNFLALRFIDPNGASKIQVGIKNLATLDVDMDCVFALSDEDLTRPLRVISTINGITKTQEYDISGLVLAES